MSPGFSSPYLDARSSDGRNFVLLAPHSYTSRSGKVYTLKVGAKSDGASVPKVFWNLIPPFGSHWIPAYYHDNNYHDPSMTKDEADSLFKEMMEVNGVPQDIVDVIYEAVHFGGGSAYAQDQREGELAEK